MPTIFGDRKKMMSAAFGKIEGGKVEHVSEDGMRPLQVLAEDILQAIRDGSAERLAHALKAVCAECESYEED